MGFLKDKTKYVFGLKEKREDDEDIILVVGGKPQFQEGNLDDLDEEIGKKRGRPVGSLNDEEVAGMPKAQPGRIPRIDLFWDHLKAAGRGKRTIQEYKYEYSWWDKRAQAKKKTIYTLNIDEIENLLKDLNAHTSRRKAAFLRRLAKWYLRNGKNRLHVEAAKIVSPRVPERLPGDHGADKFLELRKKAESLCSQNTREGIWLGLLLMCGLRESEIQTVTVQNNNFIKVLGKGNKERKVPVPVWLLEAMKQVNKTGLMGWAKKRNVIYVAIKKIGYRPHSLRHTYASELLRRGKSIEDVRVLLGHSNIATTNIYARGNVPEDAAEVLEK